MASKFFLGDTWEEVTEGDRVGAVVPKDSTAEGDQVEIGPVFMVRVVALTTAPIRIDAGIVTRYVDLFLDVAPGATDEAIAQVGQSVDQSSGLIIEPHKAIKLPMQRGRSVSVAMLASTGTLYAAFNSEPFHIWGA